MKVAVKRVVGWVFGHDTNHRENDGHRILGIGDEGNVENGAGIDNAMDQGSIIGTCSMIRPKGESIVALLQWMNKDSTKLGKDGINIFRFFHHISRDFKAS